MKNYTAPAAAALVFGIDIWVKNIPEALMDELLRELHYELSIMKLSDGASLLFSEDDCSMIGIMFENDIAIPDHDHRATLLWFLENQAEKAVFRFNQRHNTDVIILEVSFVV